MSRIPLLILGAGPTGLGAALHAADIKFGPVCILESAAQAGGLASSFVDQAGFTWDLGSHVQFSHYDKYDELLRRALPEDAWLTHRRSTWVWTQGRFVAYPYQLNLHRLPPADRWDCVRGLLQTARDENSSPRNFQDWILKTFGSGIAARFLLPYNEKIWQTPLETMSHEWVAERVARPDIETVLKGICLEEDQTRWGPNAEFRFPKRGGTGSIWRALAALLPQDTIQFGQRVTAVDIDCRIVRTERGDTFHYEKLLSTIPLDRLTTLIAPSAAIPSASGLVHTRTHIVGLGFAGTLPEHFRKTWPENAGFTVPIPVYRFTG